MYYRCKTHDYTIFSRTRGSRPAFCRRRCVCITESSPPLSLFSHPSLRQSGNRPIKLQALAVKYGHTVEVNVTIPCSRYSETNTDGWLVFSFTFVTSKKATILSKNLFKREGKKGRGFDKGLHFSTHIAASNLNKGHMYLRGTRGEGNIEYSIKTHPSEESWVTTRSSSCVFCSAGKFLHS